MDRIRHVGEEGEFVVHLIKASILGRNLIRFYYKVGDMDKHAKAMHNLSDDDLPAYPSIEQLTLPKGWDVEDRAGFVVKKE